MTPFPLFRLNRPVNVLQGSMQKVRPGTAASCFNETTDIVKIQKQRVRPGTAASYLTKTTDRVEIHEKMMPCISASYFTKMTHQVKLEKSDCLFDFTDKVQNCKLSDQWNMWDVERGKSFPNVLKPSRWRPTWSWSDSLRQAQGPGLAIWVLTD